MLSFFCLRWNKVKKEKILQSLKSTYYIGPTSKIYGWSSKKISLQKKEEERNYWFSAEGESEERGNRFFIPFPTPISTTAPPPQIPK